MNSTMDGPVHNTRKAKSYIWFGTKCFFVSTIERGSSAPVIPAPRYNETTIWEYNYQTGERGALVTIENSDRLSIRRHLEICQELADTGIVQA